MDSNTPGKRIGIVHVQAPFRISFFGGGTDFPEYFNTNGGAVLGTTITRSSYVIVNCLERLLSKRLKISYSKLELIDDVDDIEHPIIKCVLSNYSSLWNGSFLDIHSFADMPSGSGIGSSSAFTVGLLSALYALNGIYKSSHDISTEAIRVERVLMEEKGGWQDQILSSYGGFNKIEFFNNSFAVTPLCIHPEVREELDNSIMFFFNNNVRSSANIQNKVFSTNNIKEKLNYLHSIHELVDIAQHTLNNIEDPRRAIKEFGSLLDETWKLKRALSDSISNDKLDEAYNAAKSNGAYGGKLSGAGSSGFMFFLVPPESREKIREILTNGGMREVQAKTSYTGCRVIFSDHA